VKRVGGQNDAGWLFAKVMNGSLPTDRLSLMSGAPVMEDKGLRRSFRWKVLMKVFISAAGRHERSFLVGPVLGASALPGRASVVPGGAKPVLGTP
jgi:hypothetical protein